MLIPKIRASRVARRLPPAFALLLVATLAPAAALAASRITPWVPSGIDSLTAWAAQSRAMFRANTGDSLGGTNFLAYQLSGKIGRQLLRSLGHGNLSQGYAVEAVLDSFGLDTEVAVDVSMPQFALITVRNPFRATADVAGFLYWFQGDNLRYQGVRLTSGRGLLTRVWRTSDAEKPYSWGIIENARHGSMPLQLTLMRLSSNGFFWTADQFPAAGPDLGGRGDAAFADLNNDGVPELMTWTSGTQDSLFNVCRECPTLLTERTWGERLPGYELVESRLVTSAYANFVLFIRLLRDGNHAAAARLLAQPAQLAEALALGWDKGKGRGNWRVTGAEQDTTWPHWIVVRHGRGAESKSWVVNFIVRDGRWIIRDWVQEKTSPVQVR